MLGLIHIVSAVVALSFGAVVFFKPKGGKVHKLIGYLYIFALLCVNASALFVYEDSITGGPFHVLAVVSLVTLICGFVPVFTRLPKMSWLSLHAYFMSWSYVGLVSAGVGQMSAMMLEVQPVLLTVGVPAALAVLIGGIFVHARTPIVLTAVRRIRSD